MPLYEYHCEDCDTTFELRRALSTSDDPAQCPTCEKENVTRQVSLFMSFSKASDGTRSLGGGCACGGACACGGHSHN